LTQVNLGDPATRNPNGAARMSFANHVVPTSRFHPVAKGLLPMMPGANAAGFTLSSLDISTLSKRRTTAKAWCAPLLGASTV
jgi:hypothetical protein